MKIMNPNNNFNLTFNEVKPVDARKLFVSGLGNIDVGIYQKAQIPQPTQDPAPLQSQNLEPDQQKEIQKMNVTINKFMEQYGFNQSDKAVQESLTNLYNVAKTNASQEIQGFVSYLDGVINNTLVPSPLPEYNQDIINSLTEVTQWLNSNLSNIQNMQSVMQTVETEV